jgi:hypothetical protein
MTPLAHHIGEESLVNLLVLSGGGLSLIAAASRAHLAKALARLTRLGRSPRDRIGEDASTGTR